MTCALPVMVGRYLAIVPTVRVAADETFLHPSFTFGQFAVRARGELGAGTCATG